MKVVSNEQLLLKIEELEGRLDESEQLIEAIKGGEVDAFAVNLENRSEVYTLQSGDYAYRVLIEQFGEGALNVTEEGLIIYTNTYFYELINLPYEKVVGSLIGDFIHPDSKKYFSRLFKKALRGKVKAEINLKIKNKTIPVYISMTSLQPKLATVGIIITDLSEQKENEMTLARYQENLEKANDALSNKNRDLEQRILNDFSDSFGGYKTGGNFFNAMTQELSDKTHLDYVFIGELVEREDQSFAINTFAMSAFGKTAGNIQYILREGPCEQVLSGEAYSYPGNCKALFPNNPTLVKFNVEGYIGYPLFDIHGKPIGLIAAMHQNPIAEPNYVQSLLRIAAKRAEMELERLRNEKMLAIKNQELLTINKQLSETQHFLNNILESINHGVLSYIAIREGGKIIDFEIRYVNDIALEQINLPIEQVIGKRYLTVFPIAKKHGLFDRIVRVLNTQTSETHEINSPHFPHRWFMVQYVPLDDGVTATFVEITDQKNQARILEEKNRELERSNTELASFSYIASHDLQEPIRKIQTFSNRILESASSTFSPETNNYFQRIVAASKRMQNLISALLNYSRINSSESQFSTVDLNIILEDVKTNLEEIFEDKHVVVEASVLPTLHVIPHQINQLFLNIIANAIKYKKPDIDPIIKINARILPANELADDDLVLFEPYWKISISDNGIGFEQQYANRIFELFQRLHGKSEYEGTGIGLAICKKIVQNHNGIIKAISEPGVGSVFSIYLPVQN